MQTMPPENWEEQELRRQKLQKAKVKEPVAKFDPDQPRDDHGRWTQTGSAAFKTWFSGSEVVDASGMPLVVYHGTDANPNEFRPNTHFGTAQAANDRSQALTDFSTNVVGRDPGSFSVFPVYLSLKNPLRMPDLASIDSQTGQPLEDTSFPKEGEGYARGWEGEEAVATTLLEMGIINIDEFEEHRNNDEALKLLAEKGYDGIVYKNAVEDAGSDSWIVFDPANVKSAIGNRGTFDPQSPDITKSLRERVAEKFSKYNHEHDERGRFTGDGVMFHGTKVENVQRILDKGFEVRASHLLSGNLYGPGVYLTSDAGDARSYMGPTGVVLRVAVDHLNLKHLDEADSVFPKDVTPEEVQYIQTQRQNNEYLTDRYFLGYLWKRRGYDGLVIHYSSQSGWSNAVIFDPTKAKVLGVEKVEGVVYYVVVVPAE